MTLTVTTWILVQRSPSLTLAAFSVAPFIIWSNWHFALRIHQRALASQQFDADLTAHIQQAMSRVPLAQAFRREPWEFLQFGDAVTRSVRALLQLNWQEQLYPLARDSILAVGGAIILGYGGRYLVYRDQFLAPVAGGMTVGTLIIFLDYLRKLWDPLKWLTEFFAKVRVSEAAARRIFLLDEKEWIRDRPGAIELPVQPRILSLDHVAFGYRAGDLIVKDVSATILPGEMIAWIGGSGAGKSTLINSAVCDRTYRLDKGCLFEVHPDHLKAAQR